MEKQTRHWLASIASNRWDKQYGPFSDPSDWKKQVSQELVKLGSNPDPDAVDAVIGNGSWTRLTCSECGTDVEEVIQVGQKEDYESATAWLCIPCLRKAIELID